MKWTITHNGGVKRSVSEQKVKKYIEKDSEIKGFFWQENVMVLLDDQTVKVSPAQPFLAVAYVLRSSDHWGINSTAMTPM